MIKIKFLVKVITFLYTVFFVYSCVSIPDHKLSNSYEDTPVFYKTTSEGRVIKFFPILWFDGYANDLSHYAKTKWLPYAPSYKQSFSSLQNQDAYNRIKKLEKDSVATSVILYNNIYSKSSGKIINEILNASSLDFFIQIYGKTKGRSFPLNEFPLQQNIYKNHPRVNWYFMDDFHKENWNENKINLFENMLHKETPGKYLMTASNIKNYIGRNTYSLKKIDIIAPQCYSLGKVLQNYTNLEESIPEFYQFSQSFDWFSKGKQLVINLNKSRSTKLFYFITLGNFHLNSDVGKTIYRFPTYKEFHFQFFYSIIEGAKGINIYANFACSEEAYENAKRVIHEFRKCGLEKAVVNGKYSQEKIEIEDLNIKQKGYNIDYCCYDFNNSYFVSLANITDKKREIKLHLKKNKKCIFDVFPYNNNENLIKNIVLSFEPYEIKNIKIKY